MERHQLPDTTKRQLLELARRTAQRAYCPYSGFHVGAAVLADKGRIYMGCNVENASYGLTICAERSALFSAASAGVRQVRAIAISCLDAIRDAPIAHRMPCGACRQVIAEFAAPDLLALVDGAGEFALEQLLPEAFLLTGGDREAPVEVEKPALAVDLDGDHPSEAGPVLHELAETFRLIYVLGEQGVLPEAVKDWPTGPIVFAELGRKHLAAQGVTAWVGTDHPEAERLALEGTHALVLSTSPTDLLTSGITHHCPDWSTAREVLQRLTA